MVDGSLCRARHGRASETVHFPALRFVHATLSPRSRCGCVALRCGLLGAIAARLLLRLRAAGARLPASLFLAGWAVFRCGALLLSPAARAWRGSFFRLPPCWLPLCWVRVSASGPLSAGWVVLFGGAVSRACSALPLCGVAACCFCWCCTVLRRWQAFGPGFGSRLPLYGLAGVCCGAGTALASPARCALVGPPFVLWPSPFAGLGLLGCNSLGSVGLSFAPFPLPRLWTTLGFPRVGLLRPGHGPPAAASVRDLRAFLRRCRLIVGLAGITLRVSCARHRAF